MLGAAQDILKKNKNRDFTENSTDAACIVSYLSSFIATVNTLSNFIAARNYIKNLLANINRLRHSTVCFTQAASLILTAFADTVPVALVGVCLASFSSGLGETTYLGLAGHYSKWEFHKSSLKSFFNIVRLRNTIATWSSGTGMAGLVGSFSYAGLTDRNLLGLTPAQAMLVMLVVPALFMFTCV
ncbi:unnamed protein product [Strongylus vulgaris]|uniref:Battenin n=1 Tax=Strongylus vulgaris TaxID=40348 RepID=A0A3P7JDF8_STRVU|nr:unnamed protein product [Strongylus vulgaris]